ncbi:MAG: ATP-binding protein [Chloroflexi bacterium]|nr:ATP-binding protein [Chloroflexota bacterium]
MTDTPTAIVGHDSTTGSPVGIDLSAKAGPPVVLLTGTIGSGKTVALERLGWEAARAGSLVVNVAPLDLGFDGEAVIDLNDPEALPGVLDPMRVAHAAVREEVTVAFLLTLLRPVSAGWEVAISRAVRDAVARPGGDLATVLDALRASRAPEGRQAADALGVHGDYGLGRFAFPALAQRTHGLARLWRRAGTRRPPEPPAVTAVRDHDLDQPITTIRVGGHGLGRLPDYWPPTADLSANERASVATKLLLAAYALRLAASTPRHTLLLFDDPASAIVHFTNGRQVFACLARLARSMNTTIALATLRPEPAVGLAGVIGTHLAFGQDTAAGARQAADLLNAEEEWVDPLRRYRDGWCLMREPDGEIVELRVAMDSDQVA